jgi:hypothetical protein
MAKKERWPRRFVRGTNDTLESQSYMGFIGFVERLVDYGWSWPEPLRWATTLRAFS